MKQEYIEHIESIKANSDRMKQREEVINFLKYLSFHGEKDLDREQIKSFCQFAIDNFPGQSEASEVLKKYKITVVKRKRVSFSTNPPLSIESRSMCFSAEGLKQKQIQDRVMDCKNRSSQKKFRPKYKLEVKENNIPIHISVLTEINNKWNKPYSENYKPLGSIGFTVEELLLEPNLLKKFE
ncbi:hypothetical protein A0H76_1277 [Hepatospora eriocheir]|uniref:Uncharacterized protein n=1 Tax=Hepatospora eriocheir TaxID=1081669 RepID=A0A1X0Q647_9MICR|nr:hypothetical protein A0H76_1277 [Hepatospora eriocheir]